MHSKWFAGMGEKAGQRARIIAASIIGCIVTLQLGAFSVVVETSLSGITELPFGAFCALMQPIHLAIGLVEGLITAAVLSFVWQARPEMIREADAEESQMQAARPVTGVIIALAIAAAVTGGFVSHFASSNPDGLEWALFGNEDGGYSANMGLDEEEFGVSSKAADTAASIQEKTSFLPDYAFADSDSPAGTTVSGLVGSALVAVFVLLICFAGKFFRKKNVESPA